MATCTLFEEDEVYVHKRGKGYQFGLILENSEFFSSEDEDDSERIEERLKRGSVRVAWYPTGKETVVAENKVVLADRSLMPGDVVRRLIPGQETQSGFILDMDVQCHLHVKRSNKYIYNINSKDLKPLQKFESGQDVMLDSWLGKVEAVNLDIVLILPDGARCQVDENDLYGFDDTSDKTERHGEFGVSLSYPGQELKGPLEHLSDGKWLHSTPRYCHKMACKKGRSIVHVTVEKTITQSVEVHWAVRGFEVTEDDSSPPKQPPNLVRDENLKKLQVLNWFEHCSIQIADRMLYRVKNDDCVSSVEPSQAFNPSSITDKSLSCALKGACGSGSSKPVDKPDSEEVNDDGAVLHEDDDCEYEDVDEDSDNDGDKTGVSHSKVSGGKGSKKKNRAGFKSSGAKFKTTKVGQKGATGGSSRKKAAKERTVNPDDLVEVEVVFTNSWATVMWQDGTMEGNIPSVELFPVHHLDELEHFPGDFVQPSIDLDCEPDYGVVLKTDHHERICTVHWFKAFDFGKEREPTLLQERCEMSVYDIKDHTEYNFRPGQCIIRVSGFEMDSDRKALGIGQIIKPDPNGRLVVKWSNGSISQCFPQEIVIISDDGDDTSNNDSWESGSESGSSSAETWETESEKEITGEDEESKPDEDNSKVNSSSLAEHKKELDLLLSRAQEALVKLQTLLNSFDISVSAPDCFHDIIRIYRNCHDLDRILQSSFFSDPELQSLIAQAKLEIKRDRANKIPKHLTQLFESWSKASSESNDCLNLGTLAVGGKTIKVGTSNSGTTLKVRVSIEVPDDPGSKNVNGEKKSPDEASSNFSLDSERTENSSSAQPNEGEWEGRAVRKEFSEPVINQLCRNGDVGGRRPSDPILEVAGVGAKSKTKTTERNMVGENCVGKAPKRTKSDPLDDMGRDVKKSREDGQGRTQMAQELCFKICQNLQRQILKIHEEVNKRTQRLIASESTDAGEGATSITEAFPLPAEVAEDSNAPCEDSSITSPKALPSKAEIVCENRMDEELSTESGAENTQVSNSEAAPEDTSLASDKSDNLQENESSEADAQATPFEGFQLQEEVDPGHKFAKQASQPSNPRSFRIAVRKEINFFHSSLPRGIFVKGYEDRLDLYSVMILGPEGTPYEDAVFLFDLMLPNDYPNSPPICHYHSYCRERLNPNLYESGKVCVSLLGTWSGKGTEMWTSKSNLLQVLLSIQGLILVSEPYYNEAGYERQRGSQVGLENSRLYNEMAILMTVQSLIRMCNIPPTSFREETRNYLIKHGPRMISRLRKWMECDSTEKGEPSQEVPCPANGASSLESESGRAESHHVVTGQRNNVEMPVNTTAVIAAESDSSQLSSHSTSGGQSEAVVMAEFRKLKVSCEEGFSNTNIVTKDLPKETANDVCQGSSAHLQNDAPQSSKPEDCRNEKQTSLRPVPTSPEKEITSTAEENGLQHADVSSADSVPSPHSLINESSKDQSLSSVTSRPDFPLLPMSRGFRLTLQKTLNAYEQALKKLTDPQTS